MGLIFHYLFLFSVTWFWSNVNVNNSYVYPFEKYSFYKFLQKADLLTLYVCKFYFLKGSPFKHPCVLEWRFDVNATPVFRFSTLKMCYQKYVCFEYDFFFCNEYFSFLFEACLHKWKYLRKYFQKIAEDSDAIRKKTVAV